MYGRVVIPADTAWYIQRLYPGVKDVSANIGRGSRLYSVRKKKGLHNYGDSAYTVYRLSYSCVYDLRIQRSRIRRRQPYTHIPATSFRNMLYHIC